MNKATLALKMAEKLSITKKEAEDMISCLQDIIIDSLKKDEEVTIAGFGTFSSRVRHARKGVNPRKPNEMIDVPAVKVPKFKAGKRLKDDLKSTTPGATPVQEPAPESTPTPEPQATQPEAPVETPAQM